MTRRRLTLGLILYLFATAAAAPVAYWAGQSASARGAYDADFEASRRPGEFVEMTDALWDCEQFGDFDGLRTYDRVRACGPSFGAPGRPRHAQYWLSRPAGPLQLATARAIADGAPYAQSQDFTAGAASAVDPFSVALDPSGQGGDGPSILGANLPPFVLIANGGPGGQTGPDPDPSPGPSIVPLPGALPLLLTGLLGLGPAWRKRKARRG